MENKNKKKRITLKKETLKLLGSTELAQVAGAWSGRVFCWSIYTTCTDRC